MWKKSHANQIKKGPVAHRADMLSIDTNNNNNNKCKKRTKKKEIYLQKESKKIVGVHKT